MSRRFGKILMIGFCCVVACSSALCDEQPRRALRPVPFTDVKVHDRFWSKRLETNREKSIPHNFQWCEQTGRFANFARAGGLEEGKFEGIYFNDSDVYKVLEGASYCLAASPDPKLDRMVDEVIAKIAAAQQEDGYLNTYYTLVEPDKRWTNCRVRHELYCAGHLFEAAVAHFRATGKRTLLDVAIRFADLIDREFGTGKRYDVPGHEEIELALVKLSEVTNERRYLDLAAFFIAARGDSEHRTPYGPYCQDHVPVQEQSEVVGHAVRAMYLYCGIADVAARINRPDYVDALGRLWQDVVLRKMYVTGGIGARHSGESFGDAYELPNESAYCETCAAIGLALWSHRMNLMHGDAQYADVLERVLYNGMLAGVGMDGEHFFYVNPLASHGGHHRQPFYPCACCPTNVVRFIPSVPGYIYAQTDSDLYVNLYIGSEAKIQLDRANVRIAQQTDYPWSGDVKLTLALDRPSEFALALRIPEWCDEAKVTVNDQSVPGPSKQSGYVRLKRLWQDGDRVTLSFPMNVQRLVAHPLVEADRGRVAVQRGPLVYCFEAVDNEGRVRAIQLARDPQWTTEHRADLLDGITIVRGKSRTGRSVAAVPYYAWDHREPGEMVVWVRQDGLSRTPAVDLVQWKDRLYRPLDVSTLGPSAPLSLMEQAVPSASHCNASDTVYALNDEQEPRDSCDHDIPRFTWWARRGTREWVQYDFDEPVTLSSCNVYWFDDTRRPGQCRVPQSWKLLYRSGDQWLPVTTEDPFGVRADRYNEVRFQPVTTTALRIEVQLQPDYSGGILEWRIE